MGIREGFDLVRGTRGSLSEDQERVIADAVVKHLERNWRVERRARARRVNGGVMADVKITLLPESFGPAAEKLAGTVQHVVEFIAGPERVRARAQAHADAEAYAIATKAEADARAKGLESRALVRLKKRETRRQNNIEQITEKAMLQLPPPEQVSDERVSGDWTSRFFEECQDINDEQMQQIWARILAGEVARPGSFSPRTLS